MWRLGEYSSGLDPADVDDHCDRPLGPSPDLLAVPCAACPGDSLVRDQMRAAVACQHVALSAFPSLLDKPLVAGRRVAPVADTLPPYFPVGQVALAVAPACGHSVGSGRSGSSCSVGPAAVPPPGPASLRPVPAGRSWRSGASPGSCSGVLGA